jgi:hypothetical protein
LLSFIGGKNETICGPENYECIEEANGKLFFKAILKHSFSFFKFSEIIMKKGYSHACPTLKCYEACNFISYEIQISNAPLEDDVIFDKIKFDHNVT